MTANNLSAIILMLPATISCQTPRLTSGDILKLPADSPKARVTYGPAAQQYAELRVPEGKGPFPVVVVIHGGCWIQYATTEYTAPFASALTKQGWATWNLEYRRAHEPGGGWPGTFQDVGQGIDALREAAATYPLDLNRVVALGHSAGGQLALWAGGRRRVTAASPLYHTSPLPLRGVVSLAGIADIKAYAEHGLEDCAAGALRVMGGTAEEQPARYAAASPIELLPLGTRQVLVWGESDTIVPASLFTDYEAKARKAGDAIEVLRVPNAGHHELCSPNQPGWKDIVAAIRRLL